MVVRGHPALSLSRQCRLLSIGRSSLYYQPKGERSETLALMRRIDELFLKYPFYGARQMVRHLRREGVRIGRRRAARLMRLLGLQAVYRAPRTSAPHPEHRVYPYLLRGLAIERPGPRLVRRHHLYPGAPRLPLPGGDHGLGEPPRAGLAAVEHAGRGLLHGRAGGGPGGLRHAGDLQHRPGQPVHRLRLHRAPAGGRHPHLDGRPRPVHGQHLHRAAVALAQIRGGLPARDRRRLHRPARHRRVDRLLQHPEASLGARRPDAGRGLPGRHACGYDGQAASRLDHIPTGATAAAGREIQGDSGA